MQVKNGFNKTWKQFLSGGLFCFHLILQMRLLRWPCLSENVQVHSSIGHHSHLHGNSPWQVKRQLDSQTEKKLRPLSTVTYYFEVQSWPNNLEFSRWNAEPLIKLGTANFTINTKLDTYSQKVSEIRGQNSEILPWNRSPILKQMKGIRRGGWESTLKWTYTL